MFFDQIMYQLFTFLYIPFSHFHILRSRARILVYYYHGFIGLYVFELLEVTTILNLLLRNLLNLYRKTYKHYMNKSPTRRCQKWKRKKSQWTYWKELRSSK